MAAGSTESSIAENRSPPRRAAGEPPVVFYDGECGLCDYSVQKLLKLDRRRVLRYAALQGETARVVIGVLPDDRSKWSMMFWDETGLYSHSTGALATLRRLGGFCGWLGAIGLLVPRFLRDAVYRWVARNRLRYFRQPDTCRLPSPEERALFLP